MIAGNLKLQSGAIKSARLLLRYFDYMKKSRMKYIFALIFSSFELAILFAIPVINESLVKMILGTEERDTIMLVVGLFIMFLLFIPLVALGRYWQGTISACCVNEVRKAVFAKMQNISVETVGKYKSGDFISYLSSDVDRVGYAFNSFVITSLVRFVIVVSVSMFLLIQTDWRIALISVTYSIVSLIFSILLNPYVQRLERDGRTHISSLSSHLIELIRGIPIVRIFLLKDSLLRRYQSSCKIVKGKREKFRMINGLAYGIIDFFTFSAQSVGFIVGLALSLHDEYMTLAKCVFTASLMGLMADGMHQFSIFILRIQPSIVAAKRIFQILDLPSEDLGESKVKPNLENEIAVYVRNISFSYTDGSKAIDNLTLTLKRGERLAIVGSSGSGKTTLLKLLLGLYEPDIGDIYLFGADTSKMSKSDIRKISAFVAQDAVIFDSTIGDNIALGKLGSSMEDVIVAAKKANIHQFIMSLESGYDSHTGERGMYLSGGQKQRISIARAILKKSPILLLDEATAALDSQAENEVYEGLEELLLNTSSITIAHRLSTVQNADRIIVMQHGQIVEIGKHEELIRKTGLYKKLYESQYKK